MKHMDADQDINNIKHAQLKIQNNKIVSALQKLHNFRAENSHQRHAKSATKIVFRLSGRTI